MTVFGVDVSRYQGPVDWQAVAASGIGFATIKCSEGTPSQTTPGSRDYWRSEYPRAARSGLLLGAYLVVRSGPPGPQVGWFLEQLTAVGADPQKLVLQLDYEKWDYDFPTYADLRGVVAEIRRRLNRVPIPYSSAWIWNQVPDAPANAATDLGCPLWDSHYVTGSGDFRQVYAQVPSSWWQRSYGGWAPSILQYSSTATVPGVSGPCDVNAYRGDLASLRSLLLGEVPDVNLADENTVTGELAAAFPELVSPGQFQQVGRQLWATELFADHARRGVDAVQKQVGKLADQLAAVAADVAALKSGPAPTIDYDKLAAAIAGKFPAVPTAAEVADELSKRLAQ